MGNLATDRLHGHAYAPFWGFDEASIYMERETNDQQREARHRMWDQCGKDANLRLTQIFPEPIFMRYVEEPEAEEDRRPGWEYPAWAECSEDQPGAIRFWKAAV